MDKFNYIAPCHFGLESVLAFELKQIGAEEIAAENGRVCFSGDLNILARANICLRTAERVLIKLNEFKAQSFEDLFQGVKAISLEDLIGERDAFPVKGWSVHSKLASIPDCQRIVKKAAVERLKQRYNTSFFLETGAKYQLQFSILKDVATIMLDTSGASLHKRGYRTSANAAPIKETLAAGILDLARIRDYTQLYDPLCGSGTFLIEAALKARNVPPGIRRRFAAQDFGFIPQEVWREERERGLAGIKNDIEFHAYGSDIDNEAIEITTENAKRAGVLNRITLCKRDISDFSLETPNGLICTNPPYGERMLDVTTAEKIYKTMGRVFPKNIPAYIITPSENFESVFGRHSQKKRKIYNGMMKCQLYMYYGDK